MSKYTPPFVMNERIPALLTEIGEEIGRIKSIAKNGLSPHLRKQNRIRTINSSLAIEHNSLTLEQVTAIVNGKRVLGPRRDILEVENAVKAYDQAVSLDPYSVRDLLTAHGIMMKALVDEAGTFRQGGVGVFKGTELMHLAPPANMVPHEIEALFEWYRLSQMHPLIKSAIFHYEFEFIHPFADGNGRMGRLWHSLLLGQWNGMFFWMPVEDMIRRHQQEYYDAIGQSTAKTDAAPFVEFMLDIILQTLRDPLYQTEDAQESSGHYGEYIDKLLEVLGTKELSAGEIMQGLGLSHRPTLRNNYLNPALKLGLIEMTVPDKPNSSRQKYRLVRS